MSTAIVLFTRDLRVHDNRALASACADADRVVPLFVFDDAVLGTRIAAPNKVAFLLDGVRDLTSRLRDLGGALFTRRGDTVDEVAAVAAETGAAAVHVADDVTARAGDRLARLRDALDVDVVTHPGVTVVPPGAIVSSSGGSYERFTPYWRRWRDVGHRPPVDVPDRVSCPSTLRVGTTPSRGDLIDGELSPDLPDGGETAGRALLDRWLSDGVATYDDGHDDLAGDCTSRLSPYLHLGCVSPAEVVARADRRRAGVDAFVRQVCWRDYHHQVLAASPASAWSDHNDRGDDWRAGARHFLRLLVDGDVANNQMNWQWVAGTGTHSRPNRVFSPLRQAARFDPDGDYVRRYVDELAGITTAAVHRPWELDDDVRADLDYPDPIVDHDEAVARFHAARGLD